VGQNSSTGIASQFKPVQIGKFPAAADFPPNSKEVCDLAFDDACSGDLVMKTFLVR
jgi:hypothetical protein